MAKQWNIRQFYVTPEFIPIWNEFKKICDREDSSASEKIRVFVARYVAVHREGNPQLLLQSFIGKPKKICFSCEGRFPSLHHVKFVSGVIANVCNDCFEGYNSRGLIKKELKT